MLLSLPLFRFITRTRRRDDESGAQRRRAWLRPQPGWPAVAPPTFCGSFDGDVSV